MPALGVFDIPFMFRDVAARKAVAQGPVGAALGAKSRQGADAAGARQSRLSQTSQFQASDPHPRRYQGLEDPRDLERDLSDDVQGAGRRVMPMDFPLVYAALKDGRLDGQKIRCRPIANSRFYEVRNTSPSGHFLRSDRPSVATARCSKRSIRRVRRH